jgi:hypothetical protein
MNNKFKDILPLIRPDISIRPLENVSFDITINEVPWMNCRLELNEKAVWGMYDLPNWNLTDCNITHAYRQANIHGIDCLEIKTDEYSSPQEPEPSSSRSLFIHSDNESIQYVATSKIINNKLHMLTLFDNEFIKAYSLEMPRKIKNSGFGVYNDKNFNKIDVTTQDDSLLLGAGIFEVTIGERKFECLRLIDRWENTRGLVENYISRDGRSILFRRYNHPVWKLERYKKRWDEALPDTNRIYINSEKYVHWYDCLSDIVFK